MHTGREMVCTIPCWLQLSGRPLNGVHHDGVGILVRGEEIVSAGRDRGIARRFPRRGDVLDKGKQAAVGLDTEDDDAVVPPL